MIGWILSIYSHQSVYNEPFPRLGNRGGDDDGEKFPSWVCAIYGRNSRAGIYGQVNPNDVEVVVASVGQIVQSRSVACQNTR